MEKFNSDAKYLVKEKVEQHHMDILNRSLHQVQCLLLVLNSYHFLDKYSSLRKLPAEKRNVEIISNIEFFKILNYSLKQDKNAIQNWVNQYENKLAKFLQRKKVKIEGKYHSVYCKNINYLIDIIVQKIRMFKEIEEIKWIDNIEQISKKILKNNSLLNCERNFDNRENRYVYVKKMMYDLCEDIDYMIKNKKSLNHNRSSKYIERIEYRKDTLMQIYNSFIDDKIFHFDKDCTISYIKNKFEELNCKHKDELTEAKPNNENTMLAPTQTYVEESRGDGMSSELVPEIDAENLEAMAVELDLNENNFPQTDSLPKLDTTYAAASLAGVSLFGTILYKVKYHYTNEILCSSFTFYVNLMLI
ncbi:hypothetical protein PVNG_03104 [Plasmodium vivax North Korean]|uniref:Pv-fam-c protein n=1 Tax=Plasmodium vivax North Korean TaxID=1035514 RepID=A0A0J9TZN6_PLAVI|nr:hypothetical protein PVNG_03104 [Plasmodium vivax North Korean]